MIPLVTAPEIGEAFKQTFGAVYPSEGHDQIGVGRTVR